MASASALLRSSLALAVAAALAGCGGYSMSNPPPSSPPPAVAAAPSAPPLPGSYTVQRGDTIYVVARKFGVSVRGLIDANGLIAPFQLTPGQQLRMPGNAGYVVVKGDTLTAVARKTGVEFATLARINGLKPPYAIKIGQRLTLPVGASFQTAAASHGDVIESPMIAIQPAEPIAGAAQPRVDVAPLPGPTPKPEAAPLAASPPAADRPPMAPQSAMRDRTDSPPPKPEVSAAPGAAPNAPPVQSASAPPPSAAPVAVEPPPPGSPAAPQNVAVVEPPPAAIRPADAPDFLWPVHGPVLTPFGTIAKGQRNDGVNIAVPKGTPVLAAADGTVAYAGNELSGFGNMILIKHNGTDYVTVYAHNEKLLVHRDEHVKRGQKIALSGDTGGVNPPQLLFELRQGVKPIDPQGLLPNELSPAVVPAAQPGPG